VILDEDGTVLLTWELDLADVDTEALPDEPAFIAYRQAIQSDSADLRRPVADPPVVEDEAQAALWEDEDYNNELAFSGQVGSIEPIGCLDALLFSHQASRVSEIEHPTEFLASVLRREGESGTELAVVFGAGTEMFVPREAYGFDAVDGYLADGWSYWYALHNHTVQSNGDRLALGVPVPSTSDVQLSRNLAESKGLEGVRVTNGFYTFTATIEEMEPFRSR
jgi:hypothetical protein